MGRRRCRSAAGRGVSSSKFLACGQPCGATTVGAAHLLARGVLADGAWPADGGVGHNQPIHALLQSHVGNVCGEPERAARTRACNAAQSVRRRGGTVPGGRGSSASGSGLRGSPAHCSCAPQAHPRHALNAALLHQCRTRSRPTLHVICRQVGRYLDQQRRRAPCRPLHAVSSLHMTGRRHGGVEGYASAAS